MYNNLKSLNTYGTFEDVLYTNSFSEQEKNNMEALTNLQLNKEYRKRLELKKFELSSILDNMSDVVNKAKTDISQQTYHNLYQKERWLGSGYIILFIVLIIMFLKHI